MLCFISCLITRTLNKYLTFELISRIQIKIQGEFKYLFENMMMTYSHTSVWLHTSSPPKGGAGQWGAGVSGRATGAAWSMSIPRRPPPAPHLLRARSKQMQAHPNAITTLIASAISSIMAARVTLHCFSEGAPHVLGNICGRMSPRRGCDQR